MRRVLSVCVVAVVVLTAFLLDPRSGSGCHGSCQLTNYIISMPPVAFIPIPASNAFSAKNQAATPEGTPTSPTPEEICKLGTGGGGATTTLQGFEIDEETDRPLCLIDVLLESGAISDSAVVSPEATVFYVRLGQIKFEVDHDLMGPYADLDVGTVRVVPKNGEDMSGLDQLEDGSFLADKGDIFELSAGSFIALDPQNEMVELSYENTGGDEADLVIASSPYNPGPDPTPES
jgi:hypothetical protein